MLWIPFQININFTVQSCFLVTARLKLNNGLFKKNKSNFWGVVIAFFPTIKQIFLTSPSQISLISVDALLLQIPQQNYRSCYDNIRNNYTWTLKSLCPKPCTTAKLPALARANASSATLLPNVYRFVGCLRLATIYSGWILPAFP